MTTLDDDTIELANTLAHFEGTSTLYFSLWMDAIDDATPYRDLWPRRAESLQLDQDVYPEPLPVSIDSASLTYLRSRRIEYLPQAYRSEAHGGQVRVRIRAVRAARHAVDSQGVELPLAEFLERYLAQRRLPEGESDDEDEDEDDDNSDEHVKRRH